MRLIALLRAYKEKGFFQELKIFRGIERESLRVDKNGKISQKNHPKNLGSPLTNKDITTDFAEALVELVTPTFESPEELLITLVFFISFYLANWMMKCCGTFRCLAHLQMKMKFE